MSHRLVREITRRYGYGISEEVYTHISKYHFVDGHALNDLPRLASVVSSALVKAVDDGATYEVTHSWLKEYLEGDEGMREVERTYDMVCDMGINSIPNFVINGEHIIRGAAGEEEFEKVFDEIIKEGKEGEFVFKKSMGI
ncbi:hypothetical protein TrCOL_g1570 [Triparma columacea]|nr:hypothetical protein TrCOL_g1570 [Triparma columacea]